jgi:hypothetical protein
MRRGIQRQSLISFAVGLAILILYMVIYFALAAYYGEYGWSGGDIRHLIGEVPLLILYGACQADGENFSIFKKVR